MSARLAVVSVLVLCAAPAMAGGFPNETQFRDVASSNCGALETFNGKIIIDNKVSPIKVSTNKAGGWNVKVTKPFGELPKFLEVEETDGAGHYVFTIGKTMREVVACP